MSNITCPRCSVYSGQGYPQGKVVRNPYAKGAPVFDDCPACDGTGYVPDIVESEIRRCFPEKAEDILKSLRWSSDHFSFMLCGIYVGVEKEDGYIHS
jgi:hypothetical protein